MDDIPGALYTTLKTLHGVQLETETERSKKFDYLLNIKYTTVETCERFASPSSGLLNFPTHPLMTIKPRINFHAIIELVKLKERTGKIEYPVNPNSSKMSVSNQQQLEVIATFEVTACLTKINVIKAISELLDNLIVDVKIENKNKKVGIPIRASTIRKYLLIVPETSGSRESVEEYLHAKLAKLHYGSTEGTSCPKMGTCPLAYYPEKEKGKGERFNNPPDTNYNIDITYIRDHGCYSRSNTLIELIGEVKNSDSFNTTHLINAVVITTHYVSEGYEKFVSEYLETVLEKWGQRQNNSIQDEFLGCFLQDELNGKNIISKLYIMHWTHTCEYYPCYIVRSFIPQVNFR
ncbi:hypothetical protein [Thermococcus barossii]|uniref:hypothetical protein n=1 Tax=Thermococcus barossii TaxID=54077 RepID=UPI0012FDDBF4|nr:hypothetical protein [Thermococcus barossii]